jgi:hypothetical protein
MYTVADVSVITGLSNDFIIRNFHRYGPVREEFSHKLATQETPLHSGSIRHPPGLSWRATRGATGRAVEPRHVAFTQVQWILALSGRRRQAD